MCRPSGEKCVPISLPPSLPLPYPPSVPPLDVVSKISLNIPRGNSRGCVRGHTDCPRSFSVNIILFMVTWGTLFPLILFCLNWLKSSKVKNTGNFLSGAIVGNSNIIKQAFTKFRFRVQTKNADSNLLFHPNGFHFMLLYSRLFELKFQLKADAVLCCTWFMHMLLPKTPKLKNLDTLHEGVPVTQTYLSNRQYYTL